MKKLHRFFLPTIPSTHTFSIDDPKLVHQIHTVLRYDVGESFIVFSEGSDDTVATIDSLSKREIVVSKTESIPALVAPTKRLIAVVSIIKRDLFELVVQKLTELGVSDIVPLLSSRTVKQSVRTDRLTDISREAVEQSGRNTLVTIHEPMPLEKCLTQFLYPSIVCDPRKPPTDMPSSDTLVMYIGPEGGWSEADEAHFAAHTMYYQQLGSTILRTETAAIVGAYTILNS